MFSHVTWWLPWSGGCWSASYRKGNCHTWPNGKIETRSIPLKSGKLKPVPSRFSIFKKEVYFDRMSMAWTPCLELSLEVPPPKMSRFSFSLRRTWLAKCVPVSTIKARRSGYLKRAIGGKAYQFCSGDWWRSRFKFWSDDQWSSIQDEAKLLSKRYAGAPGQQGESLGEELVRLEESSQKTSQQQTPLKYLSRADFLGCTPTFSFEIKYMP